jgi:HAMP domain-containing protein
MTTARRITRLAGIAAFSLTAGCAHVRAATVGPVLPMEGQLTNVLRQADAEVTALRFGVADRLLAEFAELHPDTPQALETAFWRALFKLDPTNQTATRRDAIALLDGYLNGNTVVVHRGAALALRRLAAADRPVAAATPTATPATPAPAAPTTASAEEVQRLRDELAKANAELERIRKRLSQPNP